MIISIAQLTSTSTHLMMRSRLPTSASAKFPFGSVDNFVVVSIIVPRLHWSLSFCLLFLLPRESSLGATGVCCTFHLGCCSDTGSEKSEVYVVALIRV
jgi:hypothetical protein